MSFAENKQLSPARPFKPVAKPPSRRRWPNWLLLPAVVVAGVLILWLMHLVQTHKVASLRSQKAEQSGQIATLSKQVEAQEDINSGSIEASDISAEKGGTLSLANGKVTVKLPDDWSRATAGYCTGSANKANQLLCYDIVGIADAKQQLNGSVAVYQYAATDGTAKQWVEKKYYGSLYGTNGEYPTVISSAAIKNNSAFSFLQTNGSRTKPNYVNASYVVVHGKYAVVITAQVQNGGTSSSAFDARATGQPQLQKMSESVTFKD